MTHQGLFFTPSLFFFLPRQSLFKVRRAMQLDFFVLINMDQSLGARDWLQVEPPCSKATQWLRLTNGCGNRFAQAWNVVTRAAFKTHVWHLVVILFGLYFTRNLGSEQANLMKFRQKPNAFDALFVQQQYYIRRDFYGHQIIGNSKNDSAMNGGG